MKFQLMACAAIWWFFGLVFIAGNAPGFHVLAATFFTWFGLVLWELAMREDRRDASSNH